MKMPLLNARKYLCTTDLLRYNDYDVIVTSANSRLGTIEAAGRHDMAFNHHRAIPEIVLHIDRQTN